MILVELFPSDVSFEQILMLCNFSLKYKMQPKVDLLDSSVLLQSDIDRLFSVGFVKTLVPVPYSDVLFHRAVSLTT